MHPDKFSIDVVNTSHGFVYNIVDKNGTIYASTYDQNAAKICSKALNSYY